MSKYIIQRIEHGSAASITDLFFFLLLLLKYCDGPKTININICTTKNFKLKINNHKKR